MSLHRLPALWLLLLLPAFTAAQLPVDATTGKLTWVEVVQVPEVTAADLHARARSWAATQVQDARPLPDSTANTISLLGSLIRQRQGNLGKLTLGRYQYQLTIAARDGRYRYELIPYQYERFEGPNNVVERMQLPLAAKRTSRGIQKQLEEDLAAQIATYTADLKTFMAAKPAEPVNPKPATPAKDW